MDEVRLLRRAMEMTREGNRTIGRPVSRWADQVNMDLKEKGNELKMNCGSTGLYGGNYFLR